MKVGFTGTRNGMTPIQQSTLRAWLLRLMNEQGHDKHLEFHHGDCVGADFEARLIAKSLGYKIHCHPPLDPINRAHTEFDVAYDAKPYRERNRHIVRLTDYLIACPLRCDFPTGGTWYTYTYAKQQGSYKRPMLIRPDGSAYYTITQWPSIK